MHSKERGQNFSWVCTDALILLTSHHFRKQVWKKSAPASVNWDYLKCAPSASAIAFEKIIVISLYQVMLSWWWSINMNWMDSAKHAWNEVEPDRLDLWIFEFD